MKKIAKWVLSLFSVIVALPGIIWAAGGEAVTELVVVADTRLVKNSVEKYFADMYNTNIWMFAIWAVVLTALYGCFLGLLMDFIMARSGLDLKSRKIVEH